jgi:probable rRNA maturation factor
VPARTPRRVRRPSPSLVHSGLATVRGVAADPRIAVDVSFAGVRCPLSPERVRGVVRETLKNAGVGQAMLSVTFISRRAIARMNRSHLQHEGATDVITFALGPSGPHGAVVGDIYISPEVARENAKRFRVPVREELTRLIVHGALHAAGRIHPEGPDRSNSRMWREQEMLVRDVR